ncbi:hypothetical protein [Hymenobacter terrenus]|uniref:hypothetical protein n=1 Tax=Hymenobacter terrenus TaxID=1629124 RepID=UPI000AA2AACB|nr:hypothetical protein [Hymenobacter terrenus]
MKNFYILLTAGGLLFLSQHSASANLSDPAPRTESPAEVQRKATAAEQTAAASTTKKTTSHSAHKSKAKLRHTLRVLLGLEERKSVTSPAQLRRRLHARQRHLKIHARRESRARRSRSHE